MRTVLVILFSAFACAFARGQSFTLVGVPPISGNPSTLGEGISTDGQYVVGVTDRGGYRAGWYWTRDNGLVSITGTDFPANTATHGVSPEGEWLVGEAGPSGLSPPVTAYRYNRVTGAMQTLGNIASHPRSLATDASIGATTVVGYHETVGGFLNRQAFRWTESGGMQLLGSLPGDFYSEAAAVNADGTRIVGVSGSGNGNAFLWTSELGMTVLPRVPNGNSGRAMGLNSAGDLVVGYSGIPGSNSVGVLWRNGVPESLGFAPGYARSIATATSDDGSVIVGQVFNSGLSSTAGLWTPATGWVRLQDYMQSIGVAIPAGMNLAIATSVSADGRTIVGTASAGHGEGFVITIPSPSVLACFAAGLVCLRRRR